MAGSQGCAQSFAFLLSHAKNGEERRGEEGRRRGAGE